MSAPVSRQTKPATTTPPDPATGATDGSGPEAVDSCLERLRTAVRVSSEAPRLRAVVELHGELCPATVPGLRSRLEELVEDGITEITVELRGLRFCTSHGLDLFDDISRELRSRDRRALRLDLEGAAPVVRRMIDIVHADDPTFAAELRGPTPG